MERQLDSVAGKMLQKSLAERGMQFPRRADRSAAGQRYRPVCAVGQGRQLRCLPTWRWSRHPTRPWPRKRLSHVNPWHCGRAGTRCGDHHRRAHLLWASAPRTGALPTAFGGAAVRAGRVGQPPGGARHWSATRGRLTSTKPKATGNSICPRPVTFQGGAGEPKKSPS